MGRLAAPAAGIIDMVGGGALLAMAAMAYVTASRGFGMPFRGYGAAGAPEEKFIGVRQPRAAYGRLRMAARPRKCSSRQQPHAQGGVGAAGWPPSLAELLGFERCCSHAAGRLLHLPGQHPPHAGLPADGSPVERALFAGLRLCRLHPAVPPGEARARGTLHVIHAAMQRADDPAPLRCPFDWRRLSWTSCSP